MEIGRSKCNNYICVWVNICTWHRCVGWEEKKQASSLPLLLTDGWRLKRLNRSSERLVFWGIGSHLMAQMFLPLINNKILCGYFSIITIITTTTTNSGSAVCTCCRVMLSKLISQAIQCEFGPHGCFTAVVNLNVKIKKL